MSTIRKLAIALASLLLALLAAELALRLRDRLHPGVRGADSSGRARVLRRSDDPDLLYDLAPGARAEAWGTSVRVNSRGFRGPEVRERKAGEPALPRVVVLGDSITFGNMLPEEDTYVAQLEARMRALGTPIEACDLGVGGYDTVQEVAFLEHVGLALEPDLVVVGFCLNDLGVVSVNLAELLRRPAAVDSSLRLLAWISQLGWRRRAERWFEQANQEEHYCGQFRAQILPLDGDPETLARMEEIAGAALPADSSEPGEVTSLRGRLRDWFSSRCRVGRLDYAFARLERDARAHGFRVLVAILPCLDEAAFYAPCYALVDHLARKHGFDAIRLSDALAAEPPAALRLLPKDAIHPNARGHARIAEALAKHLVEAGTIVRR
jgi:lysophospholipase L1-like esterase